MDRQHLTPVSVETKIDAQGEGIVSAIVAVTGNLDSGGDVILPGAFDAQSVQPKVVNAHDWTEPIGRVVASRELMPGDPGLPPDLQTAGYGALVFDMELNLSSETAKEAFSFMRFYGAEQQWSIGYEVPEGGWSMASASSDLPEALPAVTRDAIKAAKFPVRLLKQVSVFEGSPVLFGMNQLTRSLALKGLDALEAETTEPESEPEDDVAAIETAVNYLYDDMKAGRIQASRNLDRLRSAHEAIGAMLAEMDGEAPPKGEPEPEPEPEPARKIEPALLLHYQQARAQAQRFAPRGDGETAGD